MSSTVSSWSFVEFRDCDFDRLDNSSSWFESRDKDVDRFGKIGSDSTVGTGGGALLGGEPEDSRFVARKNSSAEPALFFKHGADKQYSESTLSFRQLKSNFLG